MTVSTESEAVAAERPRPAAQGLPCDADFVAAVRTTVMPLVESLGLGDYWRRFQTLIRSERLPAARLLEAQWRGFQAMLGHAYDTVPFYREAMDALGVTPADVRRREDLVRLPTIDKRTLVAAFPDRITSSASDPADWCYRSTSGTAYRVMSVTDYSARQWRYALHLRSLQIAADYELGRRQVVIRTTACTEACSASAQEEYSGAASAVLPVERAWPPLGFAELTLQETQLPSLEGRGTLVPPEVLDGYLERLRQIEPYLLRGLPTFLLLLARRLQTTGKPVPRLGRIIVQDSLAPADVKAEIAATFGCPVRETYGSSELGSVAAECDAGSLHLASDLFLIEVLRLDGSAAPAGEVGELVITAFGNQAMPLVRYRLGDVGRLLPGSCPCGRGTPRLQIDGRVGESLLGPAGLVTARDIYQVMRGLPGIAYFQLVESAPGRLEVDVVPEPGPQNGETYDTEPIVALLRRLFGPEWSLRCRTVGSIRAEESGKFAFIKALPRNGHPRGA